MSHGTCGTALSIDDLMNLAVLLEESDEFVLEERVVATILEAVYEQRPREKAPFSVGVNQRHHFVTALNQN
jgi:hypothetical protein